jgi:hypothetical protein
MDCTTRAQRPRVCDVAAQQPTSGEHPRPKKDPWLLNAIEQSLLPGHLKFLLEKLTRWGDWNGNEIRPGRATLANQVSKSPRSITRDFTTLQDMGILVPVTRRDGGRRPGVAHGGRLLGRPTTWRINAGALPMTASDLADAMAKGPTMRASRRQAKLQKKRRHQRPRIRASERSHQCPRLPLFNLDTGDAKDRHEERVNVAAGVHRSEDDLTNDLRIQNHRLVRANKRRHDGHGSGRSTPLLPFLCDISMPPAPALTPSAVLRTTDARGNVRVAPQELAAHGGDRLEVSFAVPQPQPVTIGQAKAHLDELAGMYGNVTRVRGMLRDKLTEYNCPKDIIDAVCNDDVIAAAIARVRDQTCIDKKSGSRGGTLTRPRG